MLQCAVSHSPIYCGGELLLLVRRRFLSGGKDRIGHLLYAGPRDKELIRRAIALYARI